MANNQTLYRGSSGTLIEFDLVFAGGNAVSAAAPMAISYVSPGDTSVQNLISPEFYELPINTASGHYLVRPSLAMVDKSGALTVYASASGVVAGQVGVKKSDLQTVYVDVIDGVPNEDAPNPDNMSSYVAGLPQKFGYFIGGSLTSGVALRI